MTSQMLHCALEGRGTMGSMTKSLESIWIFFWSVLGFLLCLWGHAFWRFVTANITSLAALIIITFGLFGKNLWIPVVPAGMAFLISSALMMLYLSRRERDQRNLLMQLFSSHVSPDVARTIWDQRAQFMQEGRLRPQELTATVLFTDLVGFTTLSESMDKYELLDWLNQYIESMTKIIMDHGGVVNKYIGDSIMAMFGVPIARTTESEVSRDALNAVKCAVAMGRELEALNLDWQRHKQCIAKMRVGIFTGSLIVGCIGNAQRREYTVIGDTVNVASRLESFDKRLDSEATCRILIGEPTRLPLGDLFPTKALGTISLKGKKDRITVYQVLFNAERKTEPKPSAGDS